MRDAYLGIDLLFDADGDLVVSRTGDIELVTGRDCLLQDVRDRLNTLPGDLYAHPDWGCRIGRLLGALDTPLNRALAVRYLRDALEEEPRIEKESISITPLAFSQEEKRFEIRFMPIGSLTQESLAWNLL